MHDDGRTTIAIGYLSASGDMNILIMIKKHIILCEILGLINNS